MAEAVRPAAGHTQIVTEHTRFARCEVTLIGVSSYPKGKGGFIEVYHPPHAAKPVFATPTIPQGTHTFNLSVAIAIIDDVDPSVELRFMRKRKSAAAPKTIVELGSHVIDLRETPAGLCTVPVTEAAGKLKFSVASWDISGALLHSATQAAENEDDDDLLPRLLPRFVGKTSTGTITLQQLTEIALELGVDCDADTLAHIVPANSRETIFLEDCIVYIGQAIRDEREGDAGAINHGAAGTGNGRNDANALLLAPWQYLWRKCRGTLEPEAELSFTACFTARNLLFLSSFFIFTTVSTAIIVYCSLTWLDTAVGRQQALLRATQDLMRIFFTTFERVALLANSVSVKDKTETIANWMLEHWRNEQLVTLQYAEKEAARVAAMLSAACVAMQSAYVDGLVARLAGLHAVLPTASTPVNATTVTALVAEWQRNRHPHNAAGRRQRPANHVAWEWKTFRARCERHSRQHLHHHHGERRPRRRHHGRRVRASGRSRSCLVPNVGGIFGRCNRSDPSTEPLAYGHRRCVIADRVHQRRDACRDLAARRPVFRAHPRGQAGHRRGDGRKPRAGSRRGVCDAGRTGPGARRAVAVDSPVHVPPW
jgi:hypothetical protein